MDRLLAVGAAEPRVRRGALGGSRPPLSRRPRRRVPLLGLQGGLAHFVDGRGAGCDHGRRGEKRGKEKRKISLKVKTAAGGAEARRVACWRPPPPLTHSKKSSSEVTSTTTHRRRARSVPSGPPSPCQDPPMNDRSRRHRSDLHEIARRAMREKGLTPDFPKSALEQLDGIREPAAPKGGAARDMRSLLWASIDNDDSRDLDQLSVAEALPNGRDPGPRRDRGRGRARAEGDAARRARRAQHDVRLHRRRRLPDAPGEALDRPHVAEPGRGPRSPS